MQRATLCASPFSSSIMKRLVVRKALCMYDPQYAQQVVIVLGDELVCLQWTSSPLTLLSDYAAWSADQAVANEASLMLDL